jgi:hypothetical protein
VWVLWGGFKCTVLFRKFPLVSERGGKKAAGKSRHVDGRHALSGEYWLPFWVLCSDPASDISVHCSVKGEP